MLQYLLKRNKLAVFSLWFDLYRTSLRISPCNFTCLCHIIQCDLFKKQQFKWMFEQPEQLSILLYQSKTAGEFQRVTTIHPHATLWMEQIQRQMLLWKTQATLFLKVSLIQALSQRLTCHQTNGFLYSTHTYASGRIHWKVHTSASLNRVTQF